MRGPLLTTISSMQADGKTDAQIKQGRVVARRGEHLPLSVLAFGDAQALPRAIVCMLVCPSRSLALPSPTRCLGLSVYLLGGGMRCLHALDWAHK